VRQLAWLHAVPEGSKKSRLTAFRNSADDESTFLQFPDLDGAGYLVALFQEAGLMLSNGMGPVPLSWQEIEAWLRTTELQLSIWEKLTIREMSEAYVAELHKSADKHAVAPYAPAVDLNALDRTAISNKIGSVLRGLKRKKKPEDA
jgi:hypothetical protein